MSAKEFFGLMINDKPLTFNKGENNCLEAVRQFFEKRDRPLLNIVSGPRTGKTLMSAWILINYAKANPENKICVFTRQECLWNAIEQMANQMGFSTTNKNNISLFNLNTFISKTVIFDGALPDADLYIGDGLTLDEVKAVASAKLSLGNGSQGVFFTMKDLDKNAAVVTAPAPQQTQSIVMGQQKKTKLVPKRRQHTTQ